jgi:pimeloyl-ACP methyl ester carboxylesterase
MSGILINSSLVHYETFGRGKPIVFVHGWLGSWRYWVPVMEELSTDFRAYALDLWGFGDSDKRRQQYDVDSYVDLLISFIDALGLWQAPMVGHTLGAAVVIRAAARHPDRVSKVLTVGLPLAAEAINRKLLAAGPNESLARLFWHRQRPRAEVETSLAKTADNAIALSVQSVAHLDVREMLGEIAVPLLMVYGAKDCVIDPSQAQQLDDRYDGARAIVLPEASHFPMLDETAKFTRLLRDFLDVQSPEELQELTIKQEWRRRTH